MRILGIDFGEKKMGLAIATGKTALPFGVINNPKGVIPRLQKICQEEEISQVVIGLPLNLDGTEGKMAKKVRRFGRELEKNLGLTICFWDERLTTEAAKERLIDKRLEDSSAAAIILQSYLDSKIERRGGV